jgi:hypothetical protein
VARQRRHTEPLKTLRGTLTDYAEIDRFLLDGEFKGRSWIFASSAEFVGEPIGLG